jgi:carbamoyltransferase
MITWGINALNHDASIAVVNNGELRFWKRSSEYTGVAGDQYLCSRIYHDALNASNGRGPDEIVWYEHPLWKKCRQFYAGQFYAAFDLNDMPSRYLKKLGWPNFKMSYISHHLSHAAAGYYTSPFKEASVVVLDAIGEWESMSIWKAQDMKLTRVFSRSYPTSLGIFYSAFTDLIGLKPLGEEHVLQKLSEQGDPSRYREQVKKYWRDDLTLRYNLHRGVWNWSDLDMDDQGKKDLAAAVQEQFELQAQKVFDWAKKLAPSDNLVYMGGCAMNSKFNNSLSDQYKKIWSLSIPGDASSAIGAALYKQQKRVTLPFSQAKHIGIK